MSNSDNTPEVFLDEDETEAEMLRQATAAITEMLGGTPADYALKQMGPGMYAMVFNGDDADSDDIFAQIVEKLNSMDGASAVEYPEANLANIHPTHGTRN